MRCFSAEIWCVFVVIWRHVYCSKNHAPRHAAGPEIKLTGSWIWALIESLDRLTQFYWGIPFSTRFPESNPQHGTKTWPWNPRSLHYIAVPWTTCQWSKVPYNVHMLLFALRQANSIHKVLNVNSRIRSSNYHFKITISRTSVSIYL